MEMIVKKPSRFTQLLILFSVVTVLSTRLWAQPNERRQGPMLPDSTQIAHLVHELSTTLSFSDEQNTKMSELHFAHFDQVKELMQKNTSREMMDKVKKEFEEKLMAVLDDEQKGDYAKLIQARKPGPDQQRPRR